MELIRTGCPPTLAFTYLYCSQLYNTSTVSRHVIADTVVY